MPDEGDPSMSRSENGGGSPREGSRTIGPLDRRLNETHPRRDIPTQNPPGGDIPPEYIRAMQAMQQELQERRALEEAQQGAAGGMERAMGGAEPIPTVGRDEEVFSIYSQDGFRSVVVPRSTEGRLDYMRRIMADVESTSDAAGGLYRIQNQELYNIIDKLIRRREGSRVKVSGNEVGRPGVNVVEVPISKEQAERDTGDGKKLFEEWQARNAFHGMFLEFNKQADMGDIKKLMLSFPAESLNSLFRIKEVIYSLGVLHEKGSEYIKAFSTSLKASPPDPNKPDSWPNRSYPEAVAKYQREKLALNQFKLETQRLIKERMITKLGQDATEQQKQDIRNQNLGWAVNLGERLFQIGGGMSVYDYVEDENKKDGDPRFLTGGNLAGGLWAYRRLYRNQDFAESYANRRNFQPMMWNNIDLEAKTLFDSLSVATGFGFMTLKPVKLVKKYGEKEYKEAESDDNPKEIELVKIQTNREFNFDRFVDNDWESFDFKTWGATPLWNGWYYQGVDQPETAAAAIRDVNEGAQTLPSVKSLEKLRTAFFYKDDGGWEDKKQLVKNYLKWGREAVDDYGKHVYTFDQLKSDITELVGSHDHNRPAFIRPVDKVEVLADLHRLQGPARAFIERKEVRFALSFLPLWLLNLILGVLKQGFNTK